MHGTIPAPPRQPRRPALPLVLRLALRELRGGLKGFGVFLACIALGVAAIAGVSSIARSLTEGLAHEGRRILGGDLAFSLIHREANPAEREFLTARGRMSSIASMRAMAMASEKGSALVELKAVDAGYPTVGELVTDPPLSRGDLLAER
ncbi:MAG: ABC transporter permease, partial [Microvirga sp.]